MADVEVVRRAQHVLEHPGERLAERGGGVLHPGRLQLPPAPPRLGAPDRPALDRPSRPGDQRDRHEQPESEEARGEHAVDPRQSDLPAAHQRVGDAGPGHAAGGVDDGRDDQERGHAEDQAQRGQDAGPDPHRPADLARLGAPARCGVGPRGRCQRP